MKTCSTSLAVRKMQIETMLDFPFTPPNQNGNNKTNLMVEAKAKQGWRGFKGSAGMSVYSLLSQI